MGLAPIWVLSNDSLSDLGHIWMVSYTTGSWQTSDIQVIRLWNIMLTFMLSMRIAFTLEECFFCVLKVKFSLQVSSQKVNLSEGKETSSDGKPWLICCCCFLFFLLNWYLCVHLHCVLINKVKYVASCMTRIWSSSKYANTNNWENTQISMYNNQYGTIVAVHGNRGAVHWVDLTAGCRSDCSASKRSGMASANYFDIGHWSGGMAETKHQAYQKRSQLLVWCHINKYKYQPWIHEGTSTNR